MTRIRMAHPGLALAVVVAGALCQVAPARALAQLGQPEGGVPGSKNNVGIRRQARAAGERGPVNGGDNRRGNAGNHSEQLVVKLAEHLGEEMR